MLIITVDVLRDVRGQNQLSLIAGRGVVVRWFDSFILCSEAVLIKMVGI